MANLQGQVRAELSEPNLLISICKLSICVYLFCVSDLPNKQETVTAGQAKHIDILYINITYNEKYNY